MAAAADTGHSAMDIEKDGLTFETGLSELISGEPAANDRLRSTRTGTPDPKRY
jgi:hypothetical protein